MRRTVGARESTRERARARPRIGGDEPVVASTLPAERTAFLGRERDLAIVESHLANSTAVVTVHGVGGVGKTRLALRLAWRWRERAAARGVWFCDLSEARTREQLVAAVADALGATLPASERADSARDQVGRALAARGDVLLVIDNFEHLVAHAAETVGHWINHAPRARVLVTSREPLGIAGEVCYELPPLASDDGVALFDDRSRAAGFVLADHADTRRAVTALVQRLDGLPLAIELAAARTDVLAPAQILVRLDQRFELLRATRRDVIARHATLRAALEWSMDLLAPHERSALAQCAVFRGGFTAEAAEAVIALEEPSPTVLDVIRALRRKSLLTVSANTARGADAPVHLTLLESVRDFASEQLVARGEVEHARRRHASYYIANAEACAARANGPDGVASVERLAADLENIVAAHDACREHDPHAAARAIVALAPVLRIRGALRIGRGLVDAAVDAARRADDPRVLASALALRGEARFLTGAFDEARHDLTEGAELAARHAAPLAEVDCLLGLDKLDRLAVRSPEATTRLERALDLAREARDPVREGLVLGAFGVISQYLGRFEEARDWHERSLALHRAAGNRWAEGAELGVLGMLLGKIGRPREAAAKFERAASVHRETGNRLAQAIALKNLGEARGELGERESGIAALEEACTLFREAGVRWREGIALALVGQLHTESEHHADALACFERALDVQRELGTRFAEALALALLAQLLADMGQWAGALEYCDRALATSAGSNAEAEVIALAVSIGVHAATGAFDRADEAVEKARDRVRFEPRLAPMIDVMHACLLARSNRDRDAALALNGTNGDADSPATRSVHIRLASRLLDRALAADPDAHRSRESLPPGASLTVGDESLWARVTGGDVIDLRRRKSLRLVLECLVQSRIAHPGEPIAWDVLLAAGWPGERAVGESGFGRVRTAIWTLRKLGLGEMLQTRDAGYLLDADTVVTRSARAL